MLKTILPLLAACAVTLAVDIHSAVSAPKTAAANAVSAPGRAELKGGQLAVTTGGYRLYFTPKSAWTIREMYFNDKLLLSQTGAFGSVVSMRESGWAGTGHGHETVEKIALQVDGKEYSLDEGLNVSGSRFVLDKQSRFGPYRHFATIELDGGTIREKFRYEVVEDDSKVNFMYAFMHCMTNTTDRWMAQLSDGSREEGQFLDDNSFTLKKDIRWAAAYSSSDEIGLVYVYPEVYKGVAKFSNAFWNRPRDNKLYFRPELPRGVGRKFGYEVTLQAFAAPPAAWEENAGKLIAAIEETTK